jgi:ABC-type thiamine transport system substrate-binding protein
MKIIFYILGAGVIGLLIYQFYKIRDLEKSLNELTESELKTHVIFADRE